MNKTSVGNYFDMISLHYKLITTFEGNELYDYKGISLKVSTDGTTTLEYIVNEKSNNLNNEYTDSYRSSEFFNQELKLYEMWR